jgi:hypothetical protein
VMCFPCNTTTSVGSARSIVGCPTPPLQQPNTRRTCVICRWVRTFL